MTVSVNSLVETIRSILETSDLATLSRKMVRKQLETKFQSSMTEYKSLINETIEKIIAEQDEKESDESEEDEMEEIKVSAASCNKKSRNTKGTKKKEETKKNTKEKKSPVKRRSKNTTKEDEINEKPKSQKGALTSKVVLSPELAEITGQNEMTRPEIVKALWVYIHEHNLQDPNDKRNILLDSKLKSVFGRDSFTMFTMNKYIKRHVRRPEEITNENTWDTIERNGESSDEDEEKKAEKERKKEMRRLRRLEKKQETKKTKKKRVKKENNDDAPNGLNALFKISDEMKDFLNGEEISSRPNVIKKLWVYIKERNLQNPENKREILCDDLLRKLFASDEKITMFQMNRLIGRHFLEKLENWQEVAKQGKLAEQKNNEKIKEEEEERDAKKQKVDTEVGETKNHTINEMEDDDDDDDDDEDDDEEEDDDDDDE